MATAETNFTPTEIKRQATRLREQADAWNKSSNAMINCLRDIHETINGGQYLIASNDPSNEIVSSILSVKGTYESYCSTVKRKFEKLADIMEKWASSSTEAEKTASTNIDELAKKIDDIKEVLDTLKKAA